MSNLVNDGVVYCLRVDCGKQDFYLLKELSLHCLCDVCKRDISVLIFFSFFFFVKIAVWFCIFFYFVVVCLFVRFVFICVLCLFVCFSQWVCFLIYFSLFVCLFVCFLSFICFVCLSVRGSACLPRKLVAFSSFKTRFLKS